MNSRELEGMEECRAKMSPFPQPCITDVTVYTAMCTLPLPYVRFFHLSTYLTLFFGSTYLLTHGADKPSLFSENQHISNLHVYDLCYHETVINLGMLLEVYPQG